MFPWERRPWNRKSEAHVWRIRHLNNCIEAHRLRRNPHGNGLPLADFLHQELALARAWRVFWRPVLP